MATVLPPRPSGTSLLVNDDVEATAPVPVVTGPSDPKITSATTVTVRVGGPAEPQVRRRLGATSNTAVLDLLGALTVAVTASLLLFGRVSAFSGLVAFVAVAFVVFLVTYAALISLTEDGPAVRNAVMTALLTSAGILVLITLGSIVVYVVYRGAPALGHINFFTQDLSTTSPLDPLDKGGIRHAIVGTLVMITIALAITIPLGILTAVYLNENRSAFSRLVRTIVEAMTALPSIVAGLFIYATWEIIFHHQKSGFAASLAISVMTLPIIIRASDVVLRLVPGTLREASAALGAPVWRTVWHVVLPTSRSGLATAIILGTARGIGETSPVLLTAGYTTYTNTNPLSGPLVSLPLLVFKLVGSPEPHVVERGFGAATFLLALVIVLFVIARFIGGRGPGSQSNRQRRAAARRSAGDVHRISSRITRLRDAASPGAVDVPHSTPPPNGASAT